MRRRRERASHFGSLNSTSGEFIAMGNPTLPVTRPASNTRSTISPRVLIITDHTELGRAVEQHVSIVWPEAECRVHAPMVSGRFHSAFCGMGYDVVVLDDRVER